MKTHVFHFSTLTLFQFFFSQTRMTLLTFFLPQILLLISQVQSQTEDREHLCSKVMGGELERINFKSITYFRTKQLLLFEGNRKYRIEVDDQTTFSGDQLTLPVKYEHWTSNELAGVAEQVGLGSSHASSPTSVTILSIGSLDSSFDPAETYRGSAFGETPIKAVGLVVSKTSEALFEFPKIFTFSSPSLIWKNSPRIYPNFAIVARQEVDLEMRVKVPYVTFPEGFVLHRDLWKNSRQYVLYDLKLDLKNLKVAIYQKESSIKNDGQVKKKKTTDLLPPYYYIQRTTSADEVQLVRGDTVEHTSAISTSSESNRKSLFGGSENSHLPVGYRLRNYTYLFDSFLGCVYRLEHEHNFTLSSVKNQTKLKRTNIPFERFFSCDSDVFPVNEEKLTKRWPPNRCDLNYIGGDGGTGSKNESSTSGEDHDDNGEEGGWMTILVIFGGGFLLLFVLIILLIACICIFCCEKRQKSEGKGKKRSTGSYFSSSSSFVPHFTNSSSVTSTTATSAFSSVNSSPRKDGDKQKSLKQGKKKTKSRSPKQPKPISGLDALANSVKTREKVGEQKNLKRKRSK